MTIGLTFPVKGHEHVKNVPWSVVESHRAQALTRHGMSLERLYALGGLTISELSALLDCDVATLERAHGPAAAT